MSAPSGAAFFLPPSDTHWNKTRDDIVAQTIMGWLLRQWVERTRISWRQVFHVVGCSANGGNTCKMGEDKMLDHYSVRH